MTGLTDEETGLVCNDPKFTDDYMLVLDIAKSGSEHAVAAYRSVDDKADKHLVFATAVAGAVFAALQATPQDGPLTISFVLLLGAMVFALKTKGTKELPGLSDPMIFKERVSEVPTNSLIDIAICSHARQGAAYRREANRKTDGLWWTNLLLVLSFLPLLYKTFL